MTDKKSTAQDNSPAVKIEDHRRLSESLIWKLMDTYYERKGIDAWKDSAVPYYITSNPYIARAYAHVVLGWLRDLAAPDRGVPALDPSQPIYLVELGSGSGTLAYRFMKWFFPMLERSSLKHLNVKMVMTDFAGRTVDFWKSHPPLQQFVESGRLDFAQFNPLADDKLTLIHSGEVLSPQTLKNPVCFMANYFFDTLPSDVFRIHGGKLYESLAAIMSTQREPDLNDPEILTRFKLAYRDQPMSGDAYDDPDFNRILADYQARFSDTAMLMPIGPLRCLRALLRLTNKRLLLLSSDKGYYRENELLFRSPPDPAVHGSISLMVNYHALAQYVEQQGGQALRSTQHHISLTTLAFVLDGAACHPETGLAYEVAVEQVSPDDFHTLRTAIEQHFKAMTLEQLFAYVRASHWDETVLVTALPVLMELLESPSTEMAQALHQTIERVWDYYYPMGQLPDVAFCLGMLLTRINYYPEALAFFLHSLRWYGPETTTLFNTALCYFEMRELDHALEYVQKTLERKPDASPARALLITIQTDIERGRRRTLANNSDANGA
jgi:tetratricopeptide (TPR) repeat protein